MENTNANPLAKANAGRSKCNPSVITIRMNNTITPPTKIKTDIGVTAALNFLQSDGIEVAMTPNDPKLNHGHRRPAKPCNDDKQISYPIQNCPARYSEFFP